MAVQTLINASITDPDAYMSFLVDPLPLNDDTLTQDIPITMSPYRTPTEEEISFLNMYKDNRADMIASKQALLLAGITPAKVIHTDVKDLAVAIDKLNNVERLERGKSTQNIDILMETIAKVSKGWLKPAGTTHEPSQTIEASFSTGDTDILGDLA